MGQGADELVDVAERAWGAVTVRVAWTLLTAGVDVRPEVLQDARDHVWFHLEPSTSSDVAEDRAEALVLSFIDRAHGREAAYPWAADDQVPLSPRWRRQLFAALSRLSGFVLKRHYGDAVPLGKIAHDLGEEMIALEAAREGLREVVREAAAADDFPLDSWSEARLDHLIHRLACMADPDAPNLLEVADGRHPDWIGKCLRCGRAFTLVRQRVLSRSDLVAPGRAARPRDEVRFVALHLHPDGRGYRSELARELPGRVFPVGDDMLAVGADSLDELTTVLQLVAEVGVPPRDHLRGAVVQGPGRWSRHGIVGTLVDDLDAAVRSTAWGTIDGIGELPPALPEPPSARWAWIGVAMMTVVAVVVMYFAVMPDPPPVDHPLEVVATPGRGGIWVSFDVDDEAHVLVVRQRDTRLELVLDAQDPSEKIQHATGDGGYLLHTRGDAVLVASTSLPMQTTKDLLLEAQSRDEPLDALAASIRREHPASDVWMFAL